MKVGSEMNSLVKTPVLLIGGGGHCASIIDVIETDNKFEITGIVEAGGTQSVGLLGYPVIGSDNQLAELIKKTPNCIITVGQLNSAIVRQMLFKKIKQVGAKLPIIIATSSHVAHSATLAEGVVVMHQCFVNHFARVGKNTIINNHALVEHGAMIGDFCHISTGAIVNGDVTIGDECLIGSGAVLIQGIEICSKVIIGAGAIVVNSIHQPGTYVGNPARKLH